MTTYTILPGESFLMPDGSTRNGGDTIDLPPDLYATHRHRLQAPAATESAAEPATEPAAAAPAPAEYGQ